jgi:hypothetical protein
MLYGHRYRASVLGAVEYIISVTLIRVGPPGCFIHIPITTPIASALKNYYT